MTLRFPAHPAKALGALPQNKAEARTYLISVAGTGDRVEHDLSSDVYAQGLAEGRRVFTAVCGARFMLCALSTPAESRCRSCAEERGAAPDEIPLPGLWELLQRLLIPLRSGRVT